MVHRIHLFGAPGSGVSTLGRALAGRLGIPFFDTDDYYWYTEDALPYRRKRNPEHRLRLLTADLDQEEQYVVAGALLGWGDSLLDRFDVVVYRWLPEPVRLARIRERETARYGAGRLAPNGDLNLVFEKFLVWAGAYDHTPETQLRSRAAEMAWLEFTCLAPVIRLDEDLPVEALIELVLEPIRKPPLPRFTD